MVMMQMVKVKQRVSRCITIAAVVAARVRDDEQPEQNCRDDPHCGIWTDEYRPQNRPEIEGVANLQKFPGAFQSLLLLGELIKS